MWVRFGREKRMFFKLFADTGAKKRGPELAGPLIKPTKGLECFEDLKCVMAAFGVRVVAFAVLFPHRSSDLKPFG